MILVKCVTNIDKYKHEKWPTQFACRPLEGDTVRAESGTELKINRVTHATEVMGFRMAGNPVSVDVLLEIELSHAGGKF